MRRISLLVALSVAGGCATEAGVPSADVGEGFAGQGALREGDVAVTTQHLSGPTTFFSSYSYKQSDGGAQVERFRECAPDQVLTGFGGRVNGSDNFTDVTIYCRTILPNGNLAQEEDSYISGGPSQEKQLHASNGMVFVGLGGIVSRTNLRRIVAKECQWVAATRRVNLSQCNTTSTDDGYTSTESFLNLHSFYASGTRPRVVGAGAGMTSSGDNLRAVRMTSGLLR